MNEELKTLLENYYFLCFIGLVFFVVPGFLFTGFQSFNPNWGFGCFSLFTGFLGFGSQAKLNRLNYDLRMNYILKTKAKEDTERALRECCAAYALQQLDRVSEILKHKGMHDASFEWAFMKLGHTLQDLIDYSSLDHQKEVKGMYRRWNKLIKGVNTSNCSISQDEISQWLHELNKTLHALKPKPSR